MYHPYFRGKQFELITIRETAGLMAKSKFVPIIEPVKDALGGLDRALKAICDAKGKAIVIVNPFHGDHASNGDGITALLESEFSDSNGIAAGILLDAGIGIKEVLALYKSHEQYNPTFIHAGFTEAKLLAAELGDDLTDTQHVFFEKHCSKLYRRHFKDGNKVLLRDGFERLLRNADYPPVEFFSDLHVTYEEEGMQGFGDFLIVGDDYKQGGGPAYAVAIHLTYIDPDQDDVMYLYHFLSTTMDTPTDPAGKFGQALDKLVSKLDSGKSNLFEGEAIKEFRDLHKNRHFPGLGHVKKLSMKHHIETLADYLS
jgi:hypothetical protein